MKRSGKVAWAVGWFTLAAAGHACAAGMGGMDNNPVHTWQAVSEDKLDDMRGGFDVPSLAGLHTSFDIDRAVFINGNLVAGTSANIPDVARVTTTQAQQLAPVVNTVNIVQNGPNNVAPPDVATGGVTAATVIQNSLSNQMLRAVTIINAVVNSSPQSYQMNLSNVLQGALANVIIMLH